jgi:hypothetical protein
LFLVSLVSRVPPAPPEPLCARRPLKKREAFFSSFYRSLGFYTYVVEGVVCVYGGV